MQTLSAKAKLAGLALISVACAVHFAGCKSKPGPSSSPWAHLQPGDYLREEYIQAVCQTRSPFEAWRKMESLGNEALEQLTIRDDQNGITIAPGWNFHERTEPLVLEDDGMLHFEHATGRIRMESPTRLTYSYGASEMHFRFVGDWQTWANSAVIAGTYQDANGLKYEFGQDGRAYFPGNQEFQYAVGLDMIFTSYDYISSEKQNTWEVRAEPDGIALYPVHQSLSHPVGVIPTEPQWRLKRLTSQPCQ